jgi:hypothetical protein
MNKYVFLHSIYLYFINSDSINLHILNDIIIIVLQARWLTKDQSNCFRLLEGKSCTVQ